MTVTVYSKSPCVQCEATYRALEQRHIDYEKRDLDADEEALQEVIAMGHMQAPVVVADGEHWSGFRPDKIENLAHRIGHDSEVDEDPTIN